MGGESLFPRLELSDQGQGCVEKVNLMYAESTTGLKVNVHKAGACALTLPHRISIVFVLLTNSIDTIWSMIYKKLN